MSNHTRCGVPQSHSSPECFGTGLGPKTIRKLVVVTSTTTFTRNNLTSFSRCNYITGEHVSPTANINQSRFWEQAFHCPPIHYHICPNGTFCILFHSRYQSHIRQFPPPSRCWALVTTGHGTFATPMRYAGKKEKVSQTRLYLHSPGKHRMIPISPALFFNSWTFIFRTFKPKFPEWFLLTCLRHQPGKMKMSHGR